MSTILRKMVHFREDLFSIMALNILKLTEGSPTKYDHFMRVSMDKNEENEKCYSLKISIITLIHVPPGLLWRLLVASIFHLLHF